MIDLSTLNLREISLSEPTKCRSFCPARAFLGLFQEQKLRSHRTLLCGVFVAMVQATESRMRNNAAPSRGSNSATGGLFPQSRAIVVIVANVIGKKSFQVSLVPSDDVIEQITAAAFHAALGHGVLPPTPDRGSHAGDSQ